MSENKRKEGRTLLFDSNSIEEVNDDGIKQMHKTDGGTRFIVFDTIENARSAYNKHNDAGAKVKYAYYKIFFRLSEFDLTSAKYDDLKEEVRKFLLILGINNVLYLKFYTQNSVLMGSGDLTVDTKEDMDLLVSNNEADFCEGKISFYRYRVRKNTQNTTYTGLDVKSNAI